MTERPAGLDGLLDHVVRNMDPVAVTRQLHDAMPKDDFEKLVFRGDVVASLLDRIKELEADE